MNAPKTDDFRLEHQNGALLVTFTPTGAKYAFKIESGAVSDPVCTEPPRGEDASYAEADVRRMAGQLAQLAANPAPRT